MSLSKSSRFGTGISIGSYALPVSGLIPRGSVFCVGSSLINSSVAPTRNHEVRLSWAEQQIKTVKDNIRLWRDGGGYHAVFEPQQNESFERLEPGGKHYSIFLRSEPPPVILSLNIGDALFAMRSALDQLVYDLSVAYTPTLTDEQAGRTEFPVFHDRPMKAKERTNKIGLINPAAITIIEGLQPHKCRDYRLDPLWQLHEAARIDRHRLLHVTIAILQGLQLRPGNYSIRQLLLGELGPDLENGAYLGGAWLFPKDPSLPMNVQLATEFEVAFKEGPGAGRPVVAFLTDCLSYLRDQVVAPLAKFLA